MRALIPGSARRWWCFERPLAVLEADAPGDVVPVCREAEAATDGGRWAVGFLRYEAAGGFDPQLRTREGVGGLPLVRWGIYRPPRPVAPPPCAPMPGLAWRPLLDREGHRRAIERIHDAIARGDTYQANLTFPLVAPLGAVAPEWDRIFAALWLAQRSRRAVFLEDERHAILSVSPELFLERRGVRVRAEPIKGTAARGRFPAEDEARREELAGSPKDRAENVMIVDMMRNDLGRVARPGSVVTRGLCEVRSWPTVHQLVSTVEARTDVDWTELLGATFPCASITGAPKRRTMELLADLEPVPRGLYTGSVGCWAPGRRGRLNVAIRTLVIDKTSREARYGTGGGIVWDSEPDAEWRECAVKTLVLSRGHEDFEYLETLLFSPARGFVLLERHLDRLAASAERFGDPAVRPSAVRRHLESVGRELRRRSRVRLLVSRTGRVRTEVFPLDRPTSRGCVLRLDDRPIDSDDLFLFHKTTRRDRYEEAAGRFPEADDVLLWNERGELTECTRANVALRLGDRWWTPPVESGLLDGTLRRTLVERGRLRERSLTPDDLERAGEVVILNSVRGIVRVSRILDPEAPRRGAPGASRGPAPDSVPQRAGEGHGTGPLRTF